MSEQVDKDKCPACSAVAAMSPYDQAVEVLASLNHVANYEACGCRFEARRCDLCREWSKEYLDKALPHLEAHFREVMAQRLEAAATIKRRDGGACFKFAAAFLRESDR